jgi:hypothetical protein
MDEMSINWQSPTTLSSSVMLSGRWVCTLRVRFVVVERLFFVHASTSGVPDDQLRLVEGAIGESDGEGLFPFGISREWWGQKLENEHARGVFAHGLGYTDLGLLPREILLSNNSRAESMKDAEASLIGFVSVPVLSLRTLLRDEPVIDLINFDCQVCTCVRVYVCMHMHPGSQLCIYEACNECVYSYIHNYQLYIHGPHVSFRRVQNTML